MSDRSIVSISIEGFDPPPSPFGDGVTLTRRISKTLTIGNGSDQMQRLAGAQQSLAAGATLAVDLRTDNDRYGNPLLADDLCLLWVENVSVADGGGGGFPIEMKPGASNGFTNLLGAGSVLKLTLGGFVLLGNFDADTIVINGTNKTLDFTNTHGSLPATINLIAMLRN